MRTTRAAGPGRDAHRGEIAAHRLHAGADAQIAPRQDRRVAGMAQLHRRTALVELETAREVLVRRLQHRVGRAVPGRRARRTVAARPDIEPLRESGRHEDQPVGNRLVHPLNPLCFRAPAGRPGWHRPLLPALSGATRSFRKSIRADLPSGAVLAPSGNRALTAPNAA